jgi:hypothetical protein
MGQPMGSFRFVVFTNPVEGREDAYNDWYTNTHLGEVVRTPGFAAVQRFRLHNVGRTEPAHDYLAIYEMSARTAEAAAADLANLMSADLTLSDAARSDDVQASVFEICSDEVNPAGGSAGGYVFMAMANAVPGREAEHRDWYAQHVKDLAAIPGFAAAQRMTLGQKLLGEPKWASLALYITEADSREGAFAVMQRASAAKLPLSDAQDSHVLSVLLEPCSPRVTAPGGVSA